jgi:hypothetical protein
MACSLHAIIGYPYLWLIDLANTPWFFLAAVEKVSLYR